MPFCVWVAPDHVTRDDIVFVHELSRGCNQQLIVVLPQAAISTSGFLHPVTPVRVLTAVLKSFHSCHLLPFHYLQKSVQLGLVYPPAVPGLDGLNPSKADILEVSGFGNLKILDSFVGC